jgi:hypothetical protein
MNLSTAEAGSFSCSRGRVSCFIETTYPHMSEAGKPLPEETNSGRSLHRRTGLFQACMIDHIPGSIDMPVAAEPTILMGANESRLSQRKRIYPTMTLTAKGGGGDKPIHNSGSRQLFQLLHDPCQSGGVDAFAPEPLPTLETLLLSGNGLEGGLQDMDHLMADFGADILGFPISLLQAGFGLATISSVFATSLSLIGPILASQLLLKALDLLRNGHIETDGDAAVQHDLAAGFDVEVDTHHRAGFVCFGRIVSKAGDHHIIIACSIDQVGMGQFAAFELSEAIHPEKLRKVLNPQVVRSDNPIGIVRLFERNAVDLRFELEPTH